MQSYRVTLAFLVFCIYLLFPGAPPGFAEHSQVPDNVKKCGSCHKDYIEKWMPTKHAKHFLSNPDNALQASACEACHGDGARHIADAKAKSDSTTETADLSLITRLGKNSPLSSREKNEVCMQCHRDEARALWRGSSHEINDLSCLTCHQYNAPVEQVKIGRYSRELPDRVNIDTELCGQCHVERRAQLQRSSHMPLREGKITCSDCHNPHGGRGPANLIQATTNENCYTCHAEKRGPLVWEHDPVRADCSNCHDPHGSNYERMLKIQPPYLCQACHDVNYHPSTLYDASGLPEHGGAAKQLLYRACMNCHPMVHGSNHPSGARFTR